MSEISGLTLVSSLHRKSLVVSAQAIQPDVACLGRPAFYHPAVLLPEIVKGQALQKYADIAY